MMKQEERQLMSFSFIAGLSCEHSKTRDVDTGVYTLYTMDQTFHVSLVNESCPEASLSCSASSVLSKVRVSVCVCVL